jgi:hypothetical protein
VLLLCDELLESFLLWDKHMWANGFPLDSRDLESESFLLVDIRRKLSSLALESTQVLLAMHHLILHRNRRQIVVVFVHVRDGQ